MKKGRHKTSEAPMRPKDGRRTNPNTQLNTQTRKQLRTHYAAKYRVR